MNKFKVTVYVFSKTACVNPEEVTTLKALQRLGFNDVEGIRMGKCFILSINAVDSAKAEEMAARASAKLLANSVAEEYEIVKVEEVAGV